MPEARCHPDRRSRRIGAPLRAVPVSWLELPASRLSFRLSQAHAVAVQDCSSVSRTICSLRDVRARSRAAVGHPDLALLGKGNMFGGRPSVPAGPQFERHLLPFVQRGKASPFDGADVNEHIPGAIFRGDETETLGGVEPLDSTYSHYPLHIRQFAHAALLQGVNNVGDDSCPTARTDDHVSNNDWSTSRDYTHRIRARNQCARGWRSNIPCTCNAEGLYRPHCVLLLTTAEKCTYSLKSAGPHPPDV